MVDASLRATILESLRNLHETLGISFLYITHDLTTAHDVSRDIVILYRGSIVEAGRVEQVIKTPQHPYTQLLVDSIPWPDLTRRWERTPTGASVQAAAIPQTNGGCKFGDRCPHVMAVCRQAPPPLFPLDNGLRVSCYLYAANERR
jgi:peptide/nickel transport system ATP-binding protein